MSKPKPPHVLRAVLAGGSVEYLRAAGKKGARVTNERRARQAELKQVEATHAAETTASEERRRKEAANEHIIPVSGPEAPESYQ